MRQPPLNVPPPVRLTIRRALFTAQSPATPALRTFPPPLLLWKTTHPDVLPRSDTLPCLFDHTLLHPRGTASHDQAKPG
jgi:hypothetical protein